MMKKAVLLDVGGVLRDLRENYRADAYPPEALRCGDSCGVSGAWGSPIGGILCGRH